MLGLPGTNVANGLKEVDGISDSILIYLEIVIIYLILFRHLSLIPVIRAMQMRIWHMLYPSGYGAFFNLYYTEYLIINHNLRTIITRGLPDS